MSDNFILINDSNVDLTPEEITSMEALNLVDRLQTFFDNYMTLEKK